ncbi:hypothetical protein GCM10018790_40430 [Kitasatospora xanthocidica]|nr:hypothetical protein GCM10018790_40430 [Kitasatospora xanthocidica]
MLSSGKWTGLRPLADDAWRRLATPPPPADTLVNRLTGPVVPRTRRRPAPLRRIPRGPYDRPSYGRDPAAPGSPALNSRNIPVHLDDHGRGGGKPREAQVLAKSAAARTAPVTLSEGVANRQDGPL